MNGGSSQLVVLLVIVVAFIVLVLLPQRRRLGQVKKVQSGLQVGDEVMTSAGLIATVTALEDEVVVLEIAPGVPARFARGAVVRRLSERA